MSYDCYIFGWNAYPNGGINDLIMCCDTVEEGQFRAQKLVSKYKIVQLMNADGTKINNNQIKNLK